MNRPAKRSRTAGHRGEDDYRPGSIVEIELHNFMTYSHIRSQPGPRLNLVIGPNGTGKSSIVCAIGICLAGEPQLLGRASQIGDFVKRGEESGWIKISLRGDSPDEVLVITRKINKRNKSEWLFNDQSVTKKDIQEKMRNYNIQLNNLTQFLPQDRVCEFAKLTPIQLLEETEKAVGNPELSAKRQTLIQTNEEMKKIQIALTSYEASLAHIKASNADLEQDEQRMRQRNELKEKIAIMEKKLPWLKYEEKKLTFEHTKAVEVEAKNRLQVLRDRNLELKAPLEALKERKDEAKRVSEALHSVKTNIERKLHEFPDRETELGAKVRSTLCEIHDVHRKESQRQERIEKARHDVGLAEAELGKLPDFEHPQAVLNELGSQIKDLGMEAAEIKGQVREKEGMLLQTKRSHDQLNRRLQDVNTVNTRLLQALKSSGAHQIVNAYEWVQSHRTEFRKEVFGPVLLEVRIGNKEHATYVENHVPQHIWKAFITQDVEDRDFLVRNLKQFEVPVINQRQSQPRTPLRVTSEMQQLGITIRLDEVISAPPVVKSVLIGQAGLDGSFIGTSETNSRADEAPRLGVRDLWTPENHYRWQESRYGSHISASVNPVRPVRLFSENVDLREKNDLERRKVQLENDMSRLEDEIRGLNVQHRTLEEKNGKLQRQREDIMNQRRLEKKKRQDMTILIEQRKKKLLFLENEEGSADAESRLRADIKRINKDRVQNIINLKELLTKAGETHMCYAAEHLSAIELDAKVNEMRKNLQKQELEVVEAEQQWVHCNKATEICRRQLTHAKDFAQQIVNLTPDVQKKFAEMPNSIEELEETIAECKAQAAAVICNNENAIKIYEERCEQIRNLTMKVDEKRSALDRCLKEIEQIQGSWLPQLRELVFNINETFSQNFMEMAVAGEVSLDEHGTDFDQYGILIKVKFRESGDLQVLSAHHQSGGERSVSTILYLVSLQDLTYCPFRVVDEINQGMDPVNERKMFQQLVRAASKPNTPQCFLLTPKLLPDLEYTEACTVLNIMNGPWVQEASNSRWSEGVSWSAMSQLIPSQ